MGSLKHKSNNLMAYINAIKLMQLCITNTKFAGMVNLNPKQRDQLKSIFDSVLEKLDKKNDDFDVFSLFKDLHSTLIGFLKEQAEIREKSTFKIFKEAVNGKVVSLVNNSKTADSEPPSVKRHTALETFAWYMASAIEGRNQTEKDIPIQKFYENVNAGIEAVCLFREKNTLSGKTTYFHSTKEGAEFAGELISNHLTRGTDGVKNALKYMHANSDVRSKYVFEALKLFALHLPDSVAKGTLGEHETIREFKRILNDPENEERYYASLQDIEWVFRIKLGLTAENTTDLALQAAIEKAKEKPHYLFYIFAYLLIRRLANDLNTPYKVDISKIKAEPLIDEMRMKGMGIGFSLSELEIFKTGLQDLSDGLQSKLEIQAPSKSLEELEALAEAENTTVRRSGIGL